jgi:hypothetical protein
MAITAIHQLKVVCIINNCEIRCRNSAWFEPSIPQHNENFWGAGKGVICTVTEALKGGPYRLRWQKLFGCELLTNEAGCLSIRAQVTFITYHTVHVEPILYGTKAVFLVRTKPLYWLQYQHG